MLSDYHSQEDQKRKSTRVVFTEKNKNFCEYGIMKLPEKCSKIFIKIISSHQGNKATKMQGYWVLEYEKTLLRRETITRRETIKEEELKR